jgi:hypothetical protein
LTIARIMAPALGARILDNHAIYNVGFALADFRSPSFYNAVRAVRSVAWEVILGLPNNETVILTAADFADSTWGWENWQAVERLAVDRDWPLFAICLRCEPAEHCHRILAIDREQRGKLRDSAAVDALTRRPLAGGQGHRAMELDVTQLAAEDAAEQLVDWIQRLDADDATQSAG